MPKSKTRKQKQLADQRRQAYAQSLQTFSYASPQPIVKEINTVQTQTNNIPAQTIHTTGYNYLIHDLRKTLLVTGAIVVIQLLLHAFVIK